MKNVLLALSTSRQSPKTIDYALNLAEKEFALLFALFVVDPDLPEIIFSKLTDIGFMGEKPSKELMDAILKEYQQRGKEQLKEIQELAQSKRIECKTVLRVGNFVDECLRFIKEKKPMVVILTRAKRSELSRLLFGSAVNEIKKKSPVPIRIVKE